MVGGEHSAGTATLLLDGRVLIAGGGVGDGSLGSTSAELYDPSTGNFSLTGPMAYSGVNPMTATLLSDGRVLVAGGVLGVFAEIYDPSSGTFSATGSMLNDMVPLAAVKLPDGRVLMTGGRRSAPFPEQAELFDPVSGTFSMTGAPVGWESWRWGYSLTSLSDGRVLIAGGETSVVQGDSVTDTKVYASAQIYDPATGKFTPTGSLLRGRYLQTATLLADGRVLMAGGQYVSGGSGHWAGTAEIYDPSTGKFSNTGSFDWVYSPGQFSATLLVNGRVLLVGEDSNYRPAALLYDPKTGRFTSTKPPLYVQRMNLAVRLADGRVLVLGGMEENTRFKWAEVYQP